MAKLGVALLLVVACARPLRPLNDDSPPTELSYESPAVYVRGTSIPPNAPRLKGGLPNSFAITPSLPLGLSLNVTSGVLTGTPEEPARQANYTVTAINSFGSVQTTVTLAVQDQPITELSYPLSQVALIRGVTMEPLLPVIAAGRPEQMLVQPPLPAGIAVDPKTGVVSGTPSQASPETTYVLTADNGVSQLSTSLRIIVHDGPPLLSFAGAPLVFVRNRPVAAVFPDNAGGRIITCDWADPVTAPPGLLVATSTCAISGVPTASAALTDHFLRVTYDGGVLDFAVGIVVNDPLTLFPPTATIPVSAGRSMRMTGRGGEPPYSYEVVEGIGSINGDGVFTAGNRTGSARVRVTDTAGTTAEATVLGVRILVNGQVYGIAESDSHVFAGGAFRRVHPYESRGIIRLRESDGEPELSFDVAGGFNGSVYAIAVDGDSVFVGGLFSDYRGRPVGNLVKLHRQTGALDEAFTRSVAFNGAVNTLLVVGDALYAGGLFTSYRSFEARNLAKLNAITGELDRTFTKSVGLSNTFAGSWVNALASDGTALFVGGRFTHYRSSLTDGIGALHLLRLDLSTGTATPGFSRLPYASTEVRALRVHGGLLYVGGDIPTYDSVLTGGIVRVDPGTGARTLDTFAAGTTTNGAVYAIAPVGQSLYLGGTFTTVDGTPAQRLAKVALDSGTVDTTFTLPSGFDGIVRALAVSPTHLLVGGSFDSYRLGEPDSMTLESVARVDLMTGAADAAVSRAPGFISIWGTAVVSTLVSDGDEFFVGGDFVHYRGQPVSNLVKLTKDTWLHDPDFDVAVDGEVRALARIGNQLYLGGEFSDVDGSARSNVASVDIDTGAVGSFAGSGGFNADVSALLVHPTTTGQEALYVGGAFTAYNNGAFAVERLAKLSPQGAIDVSFHSAPSGGFSSSGGATFVSSITACGGQICVGGKFNQYRDLSVGAHFAKLNAVNGARDTSFAGFDNIVDRVAAFDDTVFAAGLFSSYNSVTLGTSLIGLNVPGGSVNNQFDTTLSIGVVRAMTTRLEEEVIVAGEFTQGPYVIRGLAKLDVQGNVMPAFDVGTGFDVAPDVLLASGANLLVGGGFSRFRGVPARGIVALDPNVGLQSE